MNERSGPRRTFAALHIRNYRLFWFGQLVSITGTWIQTVALAWLVLQLTDSPFALGLMSALQFTPVLLFSPFAGVIADRVPKRRLLLIAQAGMMVDAFILGILTLHGSIEFWQIAILTAALGCCNALDMPVRQAFVSEMVPRELVLNAVALNSSLFNAGRIVGPALAGLILAWQGPGEAFLLNSATYLAVLAGIFMMRDGELYRSTITRGRSVLADLADGVRYVRDTREVFLLLLLVGGLSTFGMNFNVILPVFARDVLDVGPIGLGLMTAGLAVGSLIAALTLASLRGSSRRALLVGGVALGLAEIGVALSPWLWLTLVFLAFTGAAMISVLSNTNTTLQITSPDVLRGRVMAFYMTVIVGTTPLGGLLMGTLADLFGGPAALAVGALCCLLTVGTAGTLLAREGGVRRAEQASAHA